MFQFLPEAKYQITQHSSTLSTSTGKSFPTLRADISYNNCERNVSQRRGKWQFYNTRKLLRILEN